LPQMLAFLIQSIYASANLTISNWYALIEAAADCASR
jgi:hypothetical protein